jgi:hypothetical protein
VKLAPLAEYFNDYLANTLEGIVALDNFDNFLRDTSGGSVRDYCFNYFLRDSGVGPYLSDEIITAQSRYVYPTEGSYEAHELIWTAA